jgi:hypothetical protein
LITGQDVYVSAIANSLKISTDSSIGRRYKVQSDGTLRLGKNVWGQLWDYFPEMVYVSYSEGQISIISRGV